MPGKRKREDFAAQYNNGAYIPQQDGAGDATFELSQVEFPFSFLFFFGVLHFLLY